MRNCTGQRIWNNSILCYNHINKKFCTWASLNYEQYILKIISRYILDIKYSYYRVWFCCHKCVIININTLQNYTGKFKHKSYNLKLENIIHEFDVHVTVHRYKFLITQLTRCTNFSNLFCTENRHVSDSSPVNHQEFITLHTAVAYVIQQNQDGIPSWSWLQAVSKPVWQIPLLCVRWKTPDDGQKNCPKHAEFHSNINSRN